MNESYKKICRDLAAIGIKRGDALLVHSSFKSLGGVEGGIETFIAALKDTVGEEGTLMLPTFTYVSVNREDPVFNVKSSPSCVGMIPEVFRHGKGVIRSVHPTHSLAVWGKDKEWYVENHKEDDTCLGFNSPIYKLKERHGKVLLVGCGLTKNTILHGLEVHVKPPYSLAVDYTNPKYHREYTCIDENGNSYTKEFFHVFASESGYEHDFNKLGNIVELKPQKILEAECYLFDAFELWEDVKAAMEKDPYCIARRL